MIEKIKINNEKKTEDEIILEEALTPEYDFDFEIGTNETNEEYLFRLNSFVHKERFEKKDIEIRLNNDDYTSLYNLDKSFFGRDNYSFVYEKAYSILIKHEEKEVFNNDKNKEVINLLKLRIDKNVRILNNKLDSFYSGVKYFNDTNQSRDFFPDGDYENDNISCADSLMAVEFNSKESERYLKNKLDNKNICILGGGKSLQDLIENRNIIPKSIITIIINC